MARELRILNRERRVSSINDVGKPDIHMHQNETALLSSTTFTHTHTHTHTHHFPDNSVGKESACNAEDPSSILGLGRSAEEGKGYPLHILAWRIPWTI